MTCDKNRRDDIHQAWKEGYELGYRRGYQDAKKHAESGHRWIINE